MWRGRKDEVVSIASATSCNRDAARATPYHGKAGHGEIFLFDEMSYREKVEYVRTQKSRRR